MIWCGWLIFHREAGASSCQCQLIRTSSAPRRRFQSVARSGQGSLAQGFLPRRGYRTQPKVSTQGTLKIKRFDLKGREAADESCAYRCAKKGCPAGAHGSHRNQGSADNRNDRTGHHRRKQMQQSAIMGSNQEGERYRLQSLHHKFRVIPRPGSTPLCRWQSSARRP